MIKAEFKNLIALQFSSLSFKFLFPKVGSKAENWMSMENLVPLGDECENGACQVSPSRQDLTSPREGGLVRNLGAANQTYQLQKFQVKKKGALHLLKCEDWAAVEKGSFWLFLRNFFLGSLNLFVF